MNTGRLTVTKDWRDCFSGYTINMAQKLVDANYVRDFKAQKDRAEASVVDLGYSSNKVVIYNPPTSFSTNWNPELFSCTCTRKLRRYTYENYNRCIHKAAVLLYWEKQHGPWVFTENEQEHTARLEKEKKELEKKRLKEKIEAEKRIIINAGDFLRSQRHDTRGTYFNLSAAIKKFHTNRYSVNQLEKLLNIPNGIVIDRATLQYGSSDEQELCINATASDLESRSYRNSLRLVMTRNKLLEFRCSCNRFYGYLNESDVFCVHQLAFLLKVYDYIEENDPGDATDRAAFDFFDAMDISGRNLSSADEKAVIKKTPNVVISPLLNIEDGSVALSFKIGLIGQKKVQLKNLEVFSESVQLESLFNASKTLSIDFSKQDFEENSTPWVNFIHQRVSDTNKVNDKLEAKGRWYYTPTISTSNKDELYGATLDRFYDIAEGTDCECLKKDVSFTEIDNTDRSFYSAKRKKITKKDTSYIHIGHHNMKVSIKTEPLTATNGDFIGVEVTGTMPIIRLGSVDAYIIGKDYVSRITKEEQYALLPFMKAADKSGNICFRIGKERLAEFYYRVIPFMQEHSYIDFTDTCSDMAEKIMPPEPKFTFILDSDDNLFECKVKVAYDDEETILPRKSLKDKRVDTSQETRVVEAVREFFWEYDGLRQCFVVQASEDLMFKILTEGIARFSSFGEVLGTDAFKINKVKSSPQITVGVSVESGIMDISVISKDISPKELLDILESYRLKKKYYKLKSGEFVDLSENDQFDSLTDMADRMNLPMEKLIEEGVKVPAYRALYLNKLLEEREALVSNRDKTYRTLIKNFQTIKDADYEEPEGFKDVLRPYQVYGFK